jgi:hypothetical protein
MQPTPRFPARRATALAAAAACALLASTPAQAWRTTTEGDRKSVV